MTTATTQPDIAPTLARVLKHDRLAALLFTLIELPEQANTSLQVILQRDEEKVRADTQALTAHGLLYLKTKGRNIAYGVVDRYADAIRAAVAGRFKMVATAHRGGLVTWRCVEI